MATQSDPLINSAEELPLYLRRPGLNLPSTPVAVQMGAAQPDTDAGVIDPLRYLRRPGLNLPTTPIPVQMPAAPMPTLPDPNAPQYRQLVPGSRLGSGLAAALGGLSQFAGIPTSSGIEPLDGARKLGQDVLQLPQLRYQRDLEAAKNAGAQGLQAAQTEEEKNRIALEQQQRELAAKGEWKPIEGTNSEQNTVTGETRTMQGVKPLPSREMPESMWPLNGEQVTQANQQLAARWKALNGDKPVPAEFQLPANGAMVGDYSRMSAALQSLEGIAATGAQRKISQNESDQRISLQQQNQLQNSYNFNSTQLDKVSTPIDQLSGRMSNLVTNVNFATPQADSLIAPELLSIIAGGQGSGLRMNAAEISRIVGGATNWTQLQTALNKWSLDPTKAQFTDAQRGQMRQIIAAVQGKLTQKQDVLEWGRQSLIDAEDQKTQRQVVADTKKFLDAIDNGKRIQRNKNTGELRIAPEE